MKAIREYTKEEVRTAYGWYLMSMPADCRKERFASYFNWRKAHKNFRVYEEAHHDTTQDNRRED